MPILHLNTSHVLIYQFYEKVKGGVYQDLNTSHVLIYPRIPCLYSEFFEFKYISCSYLSENPSFTESNFVNLNTSHVLIYPTFLRTSCFL